jgi:hypothetical protein
MEKEPQQPSTPSRYFLGHVPQALNSGTTTSKIAGMWPDTLRGPDQVNVFNKGTGVAQYSSEICAANDTGDVQIANE